MTTPHPDADLAEMTHEQLWKVAMRMRKAIRAHRDTNGHDLCWHHPELWKHLPEGYNTKLPSSVPSTCEFLDKCREYRKSLGE